MEAARAFPAPAIWWAGEIYTDPVAALKQRSVMQPMIVAEIHSPLAFP